MHVFACAYIVFSDVYASFYVAYVEGDGLDHDQNLVDMDALNHLEEEGHALLITEDPGEFLECKTYVIKMCIYNMFVI